MKKTVDLRLRARMHALDFILINGEELPGGDEAEPLTIAITEALLELGKIYDPVWRSADPLMRFYWVHDAGLELLVEFLEELNRRLSPYDRFVWRLKLAVFLIDYMEKRLCIPYDNARLEASRRFQLVMVSYSLTSAYPN